MAIKFDVIGGRLDLSGRKLTELPQEIGQYQEIVSLNLSNNQLKELPQVIGKLINLQGLYLRNNKLTELPQVIGQLINLHSLDLSNNQLTELPQAIGQLINLQTLYLNNNQLTELPQVIGQLINLQSLSLFNNQLTEVPSELMLNLTKLGYLDVDVNPLVRPPIEIASKGLDAIRKYWGQVKKAAKLYEAKLLIVGQGGVGKTSILNRLISNKYIGEKAESTRGIQIKPLPLKIKDKPELKLNVWDFGGQEIYHATHQFFLTKRSVYMLVWDAKQEEDYGQLEHWLNTIKVFGEGSPVILVLNKYDEYPGDIDLKDLENKFPGMIKGFFRVSCKTPKKGLNSFKELKAAIAQAANDLPHMGSVWPDSWIKIREQFEKDSRNCIDYSEFHNVCEDHKIDKEGETQLDGYLHDLGVFLHFKDNPALKDKIIIKPHWGTGAVYKVVSSWDVLNRNGILEEDDQARIWLKKDDYPVEIHPTLLALMENFEISFPMAGTSKHVIASILSKNSIDIDWDLSDRTMIIYKYDFLPKSIIPRFIVKIHKNIKVDTGVYKCWRNGAVIVSDDEKTNAYVKASPNDKKIEITIAGKNRRELVDLIRGYFEDIHGQIKEINPKLWIACNCQSSCPETYEHSLLQQMEKRGMTEIMCRTTLNPIKIKGLFENIGKYMYKVFICHSSEDKELINDKILPDLTSRHITYWIDHKRIKYGDRIIPKIEAGLNNSECVLACFSKNQIKSGWCRAEYESILHSEFSGTSDQTVIPLILDDLDKKDIPRFISGILWVKHSDKAAYERLLQQLSAF
ncbi:MAG: TIR domain-containing protein [Nitrospirae bacterium]|nr:TIR domain-containing protein [Nitrospirota bacterium]